MYGHRLPGGSASVADGVAHRWVTSDELADLTDEGLVRDGEEVCAWLHMWQNEVDEDGNAVTRSYGVPTTDVQYYVYNRTGEQQGTYRVGKFDDEGCRYPAAFETRENAAITNANNPIDVPASIAASSTAWSPARSLSSTSSLRP